MEEESGIQQVFESLKEKGASKIEAIEMIVGAAQFLGWGVVLSGDPEEEVNGLMIGTDDYINEILSEEESDDELDVSTEEEKE